MPDDPNASAGDLSDEGQEIRFAPVASGTRAAASGPGVGVFVALPDSGLLVGVRVGVAEAVPPVGLAVGVEVGADDVAVAVAKGPPGAEVGVLVGGAVGAGVGVCVAGDVGDVGAALGVFVGVLAGVFVGGGAPLSSSIPNGVVQYQP